MTDELRQYIYECKRIGLSDSQIAEKLGMTEWAFLDMLDGNGPLIQEKPPVEKPIKRAVPKARDVKPVSGVNYIQEEAKEAVKKTKTVVDE